CNVAEILIGPVDGQHGKIVASNFNDGFVFPSIVVGLRQKTCAEDAKFQIAKLLRDLSRAMARRYRLIQFSEQGVRCGHERAYPAPLPVIVQPFGDGFGLMQPLQHTSRLTELVQYRSQLEASLESLLKCERSLRQGFENPKRLLQP